MAELVFPRDGVERLVAHVSTVVTDPGHRPHTTEPAPPSLLLIKRHGLYLMANGSPRLLTDGRVASASETDASFCVYAQGCNPATDPNWYDTARRLVGGDDIIELVGLDLVQKALAATSGALAIRVTPTTFQVLMTDRRRKR